jgi:O-antigen/teichoic acid export membrane protein
LEIRFIEFTKNQFNQRNNILAELKSVNIGSKDVIWNYLATLLQIGSGVLLFPILLRMLSSEVIGIWAIFMTIGSLTNLLDFGFSPSFTRNVTYIISGVNRLISKGIDQSDKQEKINYELLSGTIRAMQWFYRRMSLFALTLLLFAGTLYMHHILETKYTGADSNIIYIAWFLFCIVNAYNIYTLYYDSLLMGCGFVMKSKQLIIISQLVYLGLSTALILSNFGLLSIVIAQAVSLLIRRILSHHFFYNDGLKKELASVSNTNYREVIKAITPNSIKLGITGLGAFLVLQSSVLVGSAYLELSELASYGITIQIINVIASLSWVYFNSYIPKIARLRVNEDLLTIRKIYMKSILAMFFTYFAGAVVLIITGQRLLDVLGSQTSLLSAGMILALIIISMLEKNHAMAGSILLLRNEVPFFKAAIISGICTVLLLFLFTGTFSLGIWGMIIAPGIVQLVYQNWKWPLVLHNELNNKENG